MSAGHLVSVIIPAYNGERTIQKALLSIVRQKYRPIQLIVVDDASKDSTGSIVEDFVKSNFFGDFKLIRHKRNLGLSRSLNDGLREACGDFVLILHQDCELVGEDWVEKALSFMTDDKVAVVTGYYGISDVKDESFVKMAFGVLRKQFHSRANIACEEVTFSEGKCDLYRKDLLLKIGGFPTDYRIAGEDLIVSYGLRSLGYSIVKCYDLPVVQRFGGAAESFWGNIGKEFLFGKAMGGVFSKFKLFLFKGVKSSKYSRSRSLHRASQPLFVFVSLLFFGALLLLPNFVWFFLFLAFIGLRYFYYFFKVFSELKSLRNSTSHPLIESFAVAPIGILTDIVYTIGFGYGLIIYKLKRQL